MSDFVDDKGMQNPIFRIMQQQGLNNTKGSNITEQEIKKHKDKLTNLIFRLNDTHNLNEDNFINNEIKNETEFLSSLLDIKRSELNQNNNMNNNNDNFFNPMLNPMNNENQMQQQMMQQQIMQQQMEIQNKDISIIFRQSRENSKEIPPVTIQCKLDDRVSFAIEKYRNVSGDKDSNKKFIYNAKCLNPTLTKREADIHNDGNIFVVSTRPPKKDECKIF